METFDQLIHHPNISIHVIRHTIDRDKPDINGYLTTETPGATPLWVAARNDHFDLVELLLEKGADPNKKCNGHYQEAPIHIAAGKNHFKSLKILLDHPDTNSNLQMVDGVTSLFLACQEDNLESLILLINHRADINIKREDGTPPLLMATQRESLKVLEWLLESKIPKTLPLNPSESWINFNIVDVKGVTPFSQSVRMCKENSFKLLCGREYVDMGIPDLVNNKNALDYSVGDGLFEMTYQMMLHGMNITYDQVTVIHHVWCIWRWCDEKPIEDDIVMLNNLMMRCTDPQIYGDLALDPFKLDPDEWDFNWTGSIERCKYWLPIKSIHIRFPKEDKDRILAFMMAMKRINKGLWANIPRPIQYYMIEYFMKPEIPIKKSYILSDSEESLDYDNLSDIIE